MNNYRAAGSGGYTMFWDASIVWRSHDEIRDMIVEYYTRRGHLPSRPDHNWSIAPVNARPAPGREASVEPAGKQ